MRFARKQRGEADYCRPPVCERNQPRRRMRRVLEHLRRFVDRHRKRGRTELESFAVEQIAWRDPSWALATRDQDARSRDLDEVLDQLHRRRVWDHELVLI